MSDACGRGCPSQGSWRSREFPPPDPVHGSLGVTADRVWVPHQCSGGETPPPPPRLRPRMRPRERSRSPPPRRVRTPSPPPVPVPVPCVWSTDPSLDDFWRTAPAVVVCPCANCTDDTIDHFFAEGSDEMNQALALFKQWAGDRAVPSNGMEGEIMADNFEAWVRESHPRVYRVIGRDGGIFGTVGYIHFDMF